MFGRFVWVRVRVITAAPAPGLSPPRLGSRGPAARIGVGAAPPKPGANQRASRAIPARRRRTNGFEAPATNGPRLSRFSTVLRTCAREPDLMWAPDDNPARATEEETIANLCVTRKCPFSDKRARSKLRSSKAGEAETANGSPAEAAKSKSAGRQTKKPTSR